MSNENLNISPAGLALIKEFEGWYPKAYKDPVGVWTIGWGTIGPEARPGRTLTKKQGEELLRRELEDDCATVQRLVKVTLNQNQFDALVSFVYNVGSGNLSKSTLLKLINRGNFTAASAQFVRFNRARDRKTGQYMILNGLTRRRKAEMALFIMDPLYLHTEAELNKENQLPLDDPNAHESGVVPDSPSREEGVLEGLLKYSDTFKAVFASGVGLVAAITQLLEPLKDNPSLFASVLLIGISMGAVLCIKLRDTQEGR
jgi:lysozyme